ncbi:MAG: dynamin family protein, partial [Sodalinema sp.]
MTDWQGFSLARARQSLARSLARYRQPRRGGRSLPVQSAQEQLELSLQKLESGLVRVAVFGAVSRGKSAVLNALLGRRVFATGPLNGVTQWTRSVMWQVPSPTGLIPVELIDTPGIDEIA